MQPSISSRSGETKSSRRSPERMRRQVSREAASGTVELRVAAARPKPSICCT
ncbi:hypothetical protein AEGHOMDF_5293 [Methylobacterium soli]|nr:hypothetical protein AEGHOMDF_5293 [Methylobacterium soli]